MTTPGIPLGSDHLAALLAGGPANVSAQRALEGLSAADAVRVPQGLPHSVAQLLAHLQFWQAHLLAAAQGERPAWPEHSAQGWPDVSEAEYEDLKARFFSTLVALQVLAHDDAFLARPSGNGGSWAASLLGFASHNVYHLGQIVLTRRALGAWPPPGGGDSW